MNLLSPQVADIAAPPGRAMWASLRAIGRQKGGARGKPRPEPFLGLLQESKAGRNIRISYLKNFNQFCAIEAIWSCLVPGPGRGGVRLSFAC